VTGVLIVAGAVVRSLTTLALLVGLASTVGFLVLAGVGPTLNPALRRVATVDVPLALVLAVALAWHLLAQG